MKHDRPSPVLLCRLAAQLRSCRSRLVPSWWGWPGRACPSATNLIADVHDIEVVDVNADRRADAQAAGASRMSAALAPVTAVALAAHLQPGGMWVDIPAPVPNSAHGCRCGRHRAPDETPAAVHPGGGGDREVGPLWRARRQAGGRRGLSGTRRWSVDGRTLRSGPLRWASNRPRRRRECQMSPRGRRRSADRGFSVAGESKCS